ncbi:choice-of-anchor J domain-containing protein [Xanthomarina sp. GH4-25]|uniref:choice-of-anchor J domain-containing protein n=1 Tax=Xanthomarina sp. GH4-25 TaxID=3349335 RepID=UPI003877BF2E
MKKMYFLFFTLLSVFSFAQVQIGTDTNQFQDGPFDPFNVYSYSQSIYLAPEINASGNITELQWYFSGTSLLSNSQDLTIYLGHTTKTEFTNTSDWEILTNLTQVYIGGIDVSAGEGWVTLTFDTPFAYNGSDNLIVAVDENMLGADNNTDDFYNSPVLSPRTITYRSSSINPDPASPLTANAGTDSYVPNIILGGITETCPIPTDGMALSTTTTTASLDWAINGSETLWDIELDVAGFSPTGTPSDTGISKPYSATGLTANTAYEFYLRADCTGGDLSAWNGPFSFRTGCVPIDDFSENFESMPDELETPYCWNTIASTTGSTAPRSKVNTSSFSAYEGDNYFEISLLTNDDTMYLVSPESSIIADGNHRIEFAAKSGFLGSETITLKVGLMTDSNDESTFIELSSFDLTNSSENNNNYSLYAINIPLNATYNYLAFSVETTSASNKTVYLDDIIVTSQPSCFQIQDIAANNITDISFDLDLTLGLQTQTEWQLTVKQTSLDYDPNIETPIVATTLTANITTDSDANAIVPNSPYLVYARANCDADGSDGSGFSDWFGPFELRSGCAAITNDFSENFDSLPDDLVTPYCWTTVNSTTGTTTANIKVNESSQAYSPGNYYDISSFNNDDTVFLISPESSIIADGTRRVEFAAKVNSTTGGDSYFKIGLMSDPNNEATFLELASMPLAISSTNTNNYSLYYVNIPFNATHNYLAFKLETTATSNKTVYLDDIVVTTQPACFDVLDVSASNITDLSFDLDLTIDTQVQTEWEYIIKQTNLNFDPNAQPTGTATASTIAGVTIDTDGAAVIPNSIYRVFVRANCDAAGSDGSGMSSWFGPYEFRTACAPVGEGFSENFDSYTNGDFPFCWYKNVTSTGSPLVQVSNFAGYANSGTNTIIMNAGNDANANVLLVLPQNTVANDGAHRLEFYARKSNANAEANIIVGTMTDPLDANTFAEITSVSIITGGTSGDNVQYFVNLPASTNEYVVLKHGAGSASSIAFYIDDVTITDQPACTEVYNITVENITASSVEVSWEFVGGQTDWEYVVQPEGTGVPSSGTPTTSNTSNTDFNSLSDNAPYEIYVRADCDTDGASPWVGPMNFTTSCIAESGTYSFGFEGFTNNGDIEPCWSSLVAPTSTSPYVRYSTLQAQEGTVSVRLYSGNDETSGIFLITPMLSDLDDTKQIVFQVYDDNNGGLEVGTMTDPTDASTFTSYQTYLDADLTDDAWDEKVVTFESYSGSAQYIAFKYNAATTFDNLYIDNFTYEINPSLSINNVDFVNQIKIYPNPTNSVLNIQGENIVKAEVYAVNGKKVDLEFSASTLDVSKLAAGMYFVKLTNSSQNSAVLKFIKN